jgi:hypothetical protein
MMPPFSDQKRNPDVEKGGMDVRRRTGFGALSEPEEYVAQSQEISNLTQKRTIICGLLS